ncbi:unnamed protein product [Bursaphelenchus xylophilus]|uniref:(pine wood nematode) hypothetical protein n=1 Tax=Bursaphelenchus xylophilus TaxID=6326 RepID=A0A1I7SCU5_BURXY|nr:unnamed protein product [Bursaphelenchus xylophilus]CAG9093464.1 unnamed protein product [Bursaphelenchus xylophilus]
MLRYRQRLLNIYYSSPFAKSLESGASQTHKSKLQGILSIHELTNPLVPLVSILGPLITPHSPHCSFD